MILEIPDTFFDQLTIADYWRDEVLLPVPGQTADGKAVDISLPLGFLRAALAERAKAPLPKGEQQ